MQVLVYAWFNKSEKITHTQNLAFVHTYTFRMKSTESFINETPGYYLFCPDRENHEIPFYFFKAKKPRSFTFMFSNF